jgi:hypothetical protein
VPRWPVAEPPASPDDCVFAKTTRTISADLRTAIAPCQFGGNPDCAQCGCVASAGLEAVARHRLPGRIPVGAIYWSSLRVGKWVAKGRTAMAGSPPAGLTAAEP